MKFVTYKNILLIIAAALAGGILYYVFKPAITINPSPFITYASYIPGTYRVGFTDLDQEVSDVKLPVKGSVPTWLSGTLYRNGPAKFTAGKTAVSHWFDGLAMLHAFSFKDGRVTYTNKFLKTSDYDHVKKTGKMSFSGFAQDPCKSIFRYIASFFVPEQEVQNANINIGRFSNHLVALYESPLPVEFDPQTLDTVGVMHYADELPQSRIHDTAHPHYDAERKEHLGYFTRFGKTSTHNLFRIKDGATTREIVASVEVEEPSYMHSFAITKQYAILTAWPLVVNPLDLLLKRQAFIKNFKWKPELGTQFIVIDRINNKVVGTYKGPAVFGFHTVNAFEQGNTIILDIITYPDSSTIGRENFDRLLSPAGPCQKVPVRSSDSERLFRYTISPNNGTVTSKKLSEEQMELPRINYDGYNGKDYTFVYAYSYTQRDCESAYVGDKLVKLNVKTDEVKNWSQNNCYPGEPVFIPAPDAKKEDDGLVLSVVLDAQAGASFLVILDATTFKEVGRANVPHHIPFGLHGLYVNQ
jgi:beta,beta-carotene 9',10'-dioxygenase